MTQQEKTEQLFMNVLTYETVYTRTKQNLLSHVFQIKAPLLLFFFYIDKLSDFLSKISIIENETNWILPNTP